MRYHIHLNISLHRNGNSFPVALVTITWLFEQRFARKVWLENSYSQHQLVSGTESGSFIHAVEAISFCHREITLSIPGGEENPITDAVAFSWLWRTFA